MPKIIQNPGLLEKRKMIAIQNSTTKAGFEAINVVHGGSNAFRGRTAEARKAFLRTKVSLGVDALAREARVRRAVTALQLKKGRQLIRQGKAALAEAGYVPRAKKATK
jgi:hypothetical protein